MVKLYRCGLTAVLFMVIATTATCRREEPPQYLPQALVTNSLFDIFFVNTQKGWAVGKLGMIVATVDGGAYWETQMRITDSSLRGVYFANEGEGWVVGDYGTVLYTENAGQVWMSQESGTENNLRDVYFFDSNRGLVVGEQGIVLITVDGGNDWNERKDLQEQFVVEESPFAAALFSIFFVDASRGWIAGDYGIILHTEDGGTSWEKQESGSSDLFMDIYFADPLSGWAVGEFGSIIRTLDGGKTWQRQESGTSHLINGITCTDTLHCFAVTYGTILNTEDAGINWRVLLAEKKMWLYEIDNAGKDTIWAVADYGEILHTSDGGKNWIAQIPWERQLIPEGGGSGLY